MTGASPPHSSGWMWDLSVSGGNDHDFYIDTIAASVLVHNCSPGERIANGHAFVKHVIERGEFRGIRTRSEFADVINDVIENGESTELSAGRMAYWKGTVVAITNPADPRLRNSVCSYRGIRLFPRTRIGGCMNLIREDANMVDVRMTKDELVLIANIANEALEAVDDWEFQTRLGSEKERARSVKNQLREIIDRISRPDLQP